MAVLLKYYNVIAMCCGLAVSFCFIRHVVFFLSSLFFLGVEAEKAPVARGYILGVREGFRLMEVHENMKCRR